MLRASPSMVWKLSAACKGQGEDFYSHECTRKCDDTPCDHDPIVRVTRAVCARCPVVDECLAEAVKYETIDETFGMRAGLTERERMRRLY